jgi:pyruvate formate lyase activating enzyme
MLDLLNLMEKNIVMVISGFQKLTLIDYPEHTACIIFTQGCNFKCPFCHNSNLIQMTNSSNKIDEQVLFDYLDKRKGLIDGVCISGGEPLLQQDIELFIVKIKEKGYKIKLDTNGSVPSLLKKLIDHKLIDYVAMDVKNTFSKYHLTAGVNVNINNIKQSIEILKNSNIDYEFRTTVVKEFHSIDDINEILEFLGPNVKYYIQNYRDCETVLKKGLNGFSDIELLNIKEKLERKYPNIIIRGREKR